MCRSKILKQIGRQAALSQLTRYFETQNIYWTTQEADVEIFDQAPLECQLILMKNENGVPVAALMGCIYRSVVTVFDDKLLTSPCDHFITYIFHA
jgi:hypothetical protein